MTGYEILHDVKLDKSFLVEGEANQKGNQIYNGLALSINLMSMKKPYYYRHQPSHAVLAERAPSGGWVIVGEEQFDPMDSVRFKEMYTDEPPIPYRIFPTGEPLGIDVKKAIEEGLYSVQLITSKDEIELFHQEHPDSWFLDGSLCQAIRYQSFPLCWVGWVKPGEPITTEANAQYGLPLFGLISMRD